MIIYASPFQLFLGGLPNILHIGACGHLCSRTNAILVAHGTVLFLITIICDHMIFIDETILSENDCTAFHYDSMIINALIEGREHTSFMCQEQIGSGESFFLFCLDMNWVACFQWNLLQKF